jgi:hypothetical protein
VVRISCLKIITLLACLRIASAAQTEFPDRITGVPPVREDSASSLSADEPTGGTPNTGNLALSDRKTGILPVREDSASSLSAHETTGWKPVVHDRQDAYPPANRTVLGGPAFTVTSDGTQSVRAWLDPNTSQAWMLIADYTNGGSERFLDGLVEPDKRPLKPGTTVAAAFHILCKRGTGGPPVGQ